MLTFGSLVLLLVDVMIKFTWANSALIRRCWLRGGTWAKMAK
jgi:hypothetical protein